MGTERNREAHTKILVVDDRKENLYAMQRTLRTLGCEVFTAESGNEALSFTLRHDFALLLLDVNMPEMDGFELAELLRMNEETKNIPIIFVTAINKEDKSVFKGYETGAVDYLFKPVDTDILLSKVKVFLELNRKKKELEQIQAELERSNQCLREFAQVVSHDLKNPLNVITGLCELMETKHGEGLGPRGKQYLSHITDAAQRMTSLITDILRFSETNARPGQLAEVDLNRVLDDVLADLGSRLKQTEGRVEKQEPLPVVEADPTQMYQLLLNLVGNAVKYHRPDCPPRVRVYGDTADTEQGVAFVIEDNGIGMKAEDIPSIFDPFQRLDNAQGYEGTGLGLATVKGIVERHRGRIEVSSEPGVGTKFRVMLQSRRMGS
ncbi:MULTISPECIES: sensor histidine kinase [Paenibacillus]|uniref:sensor histidine kinase n=1 Tax=Paenibacillus TaxID=44249 RepID=UPI0022B87841|nr:ATP-binding protein [Paenibacillus caseinilyticus]MCZ8518621.1 response regulator [Paenibacillus caseinilyticus]